MKNILLAPPIAFVIYLFVSFIISKFSTLLAAKGQYAAGKEKSYACGEDVLDHKVRPDYTQFFPFAFFFTIMHVIALIVTTVPKDIPMISILYLVIAVVSIFILFRR